MSRYRPLILLVVALTAWLIASPVASAEAPKVIGESYFVPAKDPGIQLHVPNKRPDGLSRFGSDRIVLFVHGATFNAESGFDVPLGGVSWMDYVARRGWDVYAVDLRAYGRSTRPPEMNQPPGENPPIVNTDVAVRDVGAVVDHILARRGVAKINLVGWSWGTTITGGYAAQNSAKVERLVLYAPLWVLKASPPPPIGGTGPLGAYRTVTKEAVRQRLARGLTPEKAKDLMSDEAFDMWWAAALGTDPVGAAQNPPVVRAPNGIIEDLRKYWIAGKPYYDPSQITVPTLIILAEWDADTPPYMAQEVFARLKNAPVRRMVMIGEGTHGVSLEKNRMQLFREVQLFLEEPR